MHRGWARLIEVQNLTKTYAGGQGVTDVSFVAKQGEILGLLGPNGAGKTTTIRTLTGYHPPTSGVVRVAGVDVVEQPQQARKQVGYLPEQPPVYHEMTVRAYLRFVAELKDVPKNQIGAATDGVIDRLGLGGVAGRLIANLSKGFKQRVGLAQALLGDPPVLIFDEPTVGLDPKQIIEVRELIRSLGGRHTVLLSSHILPEVQQVCHRVVIMNQGRLVAVDTPGELAQRLQQSQVIELMVRGEAEQVREALERIPAVRRVRVMPDAAHAADEGKPANGTVRLQVEAEPKVDVRERVFFGLAAAALPILEMRQVAISLEEVFLQLTMSDEAGEHHA